jgi:molecular chaperone DnaK (HSP70)
MPAGMPKIEVTFLIDANGILQVKARERRSGKAASIEVKPTYGLSESDVERMIEDSFTYAEADVETRMLIEARNEADTVLVHAGRALKQGADLVPADERAAIEAAVAALRTAREGDDRDRIHAATTAVNRATEHLAELLMDAALKGALGSRRATEILGER